MSSPRPLLLDLFSGAGGGAVGYHRAGFGVIGVDVKPQKNYPFTFIQDDAIVVLKSVIENGMTFLDLPVAAIHASPPCQDHSKYTSQWGNSRGTGQLLDQTRQLLQDTGVPWVIENVPGADMRVDYRLCGCMFPGQTKWLRRERWFETSWGTGAQPLCYHKKGERVISVTGHPGGTSTRDGDVGRGSAAEWKEAMGIDWMSARELAQAIPPAMTHFIGKELLERAMA